MSNDKDKCKTCLEKPQKNTKSIKCSVCQQIYHVRAKCLDMEDEVYNALNTGKLKNNLFWCCSSCEKFAKSFIDGINNLMTELGNTKRDLAQEVSDRVALKESVDKLEERISKVEPKVIVVDQLEEKSKSYAETAMKKYTDQFPALQEASINRIVTQKVQEIQETVIPTTEIEGRLEEVEIRMRDDQREIELRKKNAIVHNLEEANTQDKEVRKNHDISQVDEFMEKCGADGSRPVYYQRLGKIPEDANRPRPLKIVFESEEAKLNLVKRYCHTKRNGTEDEKEGIKNMSIVPDRTQKEREEYKKLRNQLDERVRKGEKNLVIINWKIRQKN